MTPCAMAVLPIWIRQALPDIRDNMSGGGTARRRTTAPRHRRAYSDLSDAVNNDEPVFVTRATTAEMTPTHRRMGGIPPTRMHKFHA